MGLAIAAIVVGMIGFASVMTYGKVLVKNPWVRGIVLAAFLVLYVSGLDYLGNHVPTGHVLTWTKE